MQATMIGLDIAKNVFQVHGVDGQGRVVLRKRLARARVLGFFVNLPRCRVGLEAGGGAHHWARELQALGHDARLMPPQYVKAYVKANKHDAADAEACCEAVQRPGMRFVPVKSEDQQATLMLHRVRDQLISQRTATINALRGHLTEFGIVAVQRQAGMRSLLAVLNEAEDDRIPPLAREVLQTLATHLRELESKLAALDRRLVALTRTDRTCRMLSQVPGIGPVIATAFAATVPDAGAFRSGPPSRRLARPGPQAAQQRRQGAPSRPQQTRRWLPASPADPRRPGPGVAHPGPGRQAAFVDQRLAATPAVQRRGRRGRQQAGPDPLGDAPSRRALSGRGVAAPDRTFHELRGRTSR